MRDTTVELGETLLWANRIRIENVALNKKVDNQTHTIQLLQSKAEQQESEFVNIRKQLHANTKLVEKLNNDLAQQHQRDLDREAELDQLVHINENAIAEIDTSVKSLAKYAQDMKTTIDRDILQVMPVLQSKQEEHTEDIITLVDNVQELQKARTEQSRELWAHENRLTNIDADRDVIHRNLVIFARCCKQVDNDIPKANKNATQALDLAQSVERMVVEQGKQLDSLRINPEYSHERRTTVAKPSKLKKEPIVNPVFNGASPIDSQATTQWDGSVPPPSSSPQLVSSQLWSSPRPARLVREKARALPVPIFQLSQTTGEAKQASGSRMHPTMLRKDASIPDQMSSFTAMRSSQLEAPDYSQISEVAQYPRRSTGTTPPPIVILDSSEPPSSNVPATTEARSANTSVKRHAEVVVDSQQPSEAPVAAPPAQKKYKPNRKISLDNW